MEAIDREQLLEDLRTVSADGDTPPNVSTVVAECDGGIRDYIAEFGTWYDALEAAGVTGDRDPPDVSPEELAAELERVAAELDGPPTGEQITERGSYDIETYEAVFGSYLIALEEAGIEPSTNQYNFAEVDPPEHRGATENVRHLREHGPTPSSEMPQGSSVSDRQHGMWKFVVRAGKAATDSAGGMPEPVYFLKEEHDPETVMRTFFEVNDQMVDSKSYHGLITGVRDHSPEWAEIAKEFLPELVDGEAPDDETPPGILVIEATDETIANAIEATVANQTSDLQAIDGIERDVGYAWGLPEEQEERWSRVNPGDIVLASTDSEMYAFTVDERVRDWNATTTLWAQYDDGIRVEGPDQPWPFLLVGTSGGRAAFDTDEFWNLVTAERTDSAIQHLSAETLSPLREQYESFWNFARRHDNQSDQDRGQQQSDSRVDVNKDGNKNSDGRQNVAATAGSSGSGELAEPNETVKENGEPEATAHTVEVSAVVAALAMRRDEGFIADAVSEHLKRAVDGSEPTVTQVSARETAPVPLDLTANQRTLVDALCEDDSEYASTAAFVEDALRARLDIADVQREFSITLEGPTAAVLSELAEEAGKEPAQLVEEQVQMFVADSM